MEQDLSDMSSNPEPSSAGIIAIHNSYLDNKLLNNDTDALSTASCDSKSFTETAPLQTESMDVCKILGTDGENSSIDQSNIGACDGESTALDGQLIHEPPAAASASELSSVDQLTTQENLSHQLKDSSDLKSDIKEVCLSDTKEICNLPVDNVCDNDDKVSGYQLPACEKSLSGTDQMPLPMNRRCSSELVLARMDNFDAMLDISSDDKDVKVIQEQLGEEESLSGIAADKDDSEFEGSSDLDYLSNEEEEEDGDDDEDDDTTDGDLKKADLLEEYSEKCSGNVDVPEIVDLKDENVSKSPGECEKSAIGN